MFRYLSLSDLILLSISNTFKIQPRCCKWSYVNNSTFYETFSILSLTNTLSLYCHSQPQHTHLVFSIFILLSESVTSISKSLTLQVKDISSPNLVTEGNTFFVFVHHHVFMIKSTCMYCSPTSNFLEEETVLTGTLSLPC